MKRTHFSSLVDDYIDFRFSVVKGSKSEANNIKQFCKFADKFSNKTILTLELVNEYLASLKNPKPTTKYGQCKSLRAFSLYLNQRDPKNVVIPYRYVKRPPSSFKPYIFSEKEVVTMMNYARTKLWTGPQILIVPVLYETLIGLLWSTGMRLKEAVNLNVGDIDFQSGVIHIKQTKFYKSRLLPLHPSTSAALMRYLEERNSFNYPKSPGTPFFFNWRMRGGTRKGRYTTDAFHEKIHQIIVVLDIRAANGRLARPYDLRHSFATLRLNEIYEGEALRKLPLIATYMGHAKLTYTQI